MQERTLLIIIVTALLIITLLLFLASISAIPSLQQAPKQKQTTCTQIQIPYKAIETYTELIPTSRKDCYKSEIEYRAQKNIRHTDSRTACYLEIKNLDYGKEGRWEVRFDFYNEDNKKTSKYVSAYLKPRETKEFQASISESDASCSAKVIEAPVRTFCDSYQDYNEVVKQREVTRYASQVVCS